MHAGLVRQRLAEHLQARLLIENHRVKGGSREVVDVAALGLVRAKLVQRRHDVEKVDGGELRHVVDRNVHVAVQALLHKGAVDVDILAHLDAEGAKGVFRREQREVPEGTRGKNRKKRTERRRDYSRFNKVHLALLLIYALLKLS